MARRGLPVNQKRPHAYGTTMDGKYTYSIYIKLKSVITLLQNMVQFVFQFFFSKMVIFLECILEKILIIQYALNGLFSKLCQIQDLFVCA